MKKSRVLYASMKRGEKVFGVIWLVLQVFLGYFMTLANDLLPQKLDTYLLNFTVFAVNFLVVICIFSHFLRESFVTALRGLWELAQAVILGFVFYWACDWAFVKVLSLLLTNYVPLVDASISALYYANWYLLVIGTVVLVPVIEEVLFRGLVFRNLMRKKKVLAYILSMLLFAVSHILGYLGSQDITALVLCFVRYLPAGLCLAWTYTKADNIFAPILVHAAINAISIGLLNT